MSLLPEEHSETNFDVLGIIDYKMEIINKKESLKELKLQFVQNAIISLKKLDASKIGANQWSNIRVALSHLENLEKH